MKKILAILVLGLLWCDVTLANVLTVHSEIYKAMKEIKSGRTYKGITGYIIRPEDEKNPSKFPIILPKNSAPIISDYKSIFGANWEYGLKRNKQNAQGNKHGGIDFYVKTGSPILASNDGSVIKATIDSCAGPLLVIRHTGNKYATYMHIGEFKVKKGDVVKRGQLIAHAGALVSTRCGGGIEHLHFQISSEGPCRNCTGSWKYLGKFKSWRNPHNYWTGGKGKPECFVEGKEYKKKLLTLPFQCHNL